MAKLVVFLSVLVVLCCVTLVSCKTPPANPKEFVTNTCMFHTTKGGSIYDLCVKDLTPFASEIKGDDKRLAMKAVSISKDKVKSSIKLLKKLKHDKKTTTTDDGAAAKAADSCTLNFVQAAEQIGWAEASLKSIGQPKSNSSSINNENVNNWLHESQANASACVSDMESFKNTNLADAYNSLDEASNTIGYTSQLVDAYLKSLTPPAPQPKSAGSPSPSPSPSSSSSSAWEGAIQDKCYKYAVGYYDSCQADMLGALPKDTDLNETTIAFLAVNVSISKADSLVSDMNGILSNKTTSQKDKQAARTCVGKLHTSLMPLDKLPVLNAKYFDDVVGFLQGVAASENDCLNSAKKFEVNAAAVELNISFALESTKMAIAMSKDYNKNLAPTS